MCNVVNATGIYKFVINLLKFSSKPDHFIAAVGNVLSIDIVQLTKLLSKLPP